MGRNQTRDTTLSLDTVAIIRRLYPRLQSFWESHLLHSEVTVQTFYAAMRTEPISPEVDQLIESSLDYDMRKIGVKKDDLDLIPAFSHVDIMEDMRRFLEKLIKNSGTFQAAELMELVIKVRLQAFILSNSG